MSKKKSITEEVIKLANFRREYKLNKLSEESVLENPVMQFSLWFNELTRTKPVEPNAMILATADKNTKPSARVVLLKDYSNEGFTFFTNYKSRKGKELSKNPFASLLFYWDKLERQVRIEGRIKKLSREESVEYFNSRPLKSRLSTWVSMQSSEVPDRKFLEESFEKYEKKFFGRTIPTPPYWGGFILIPDYFEFWQGRENRLHDRVAFKKKKGKWEIVRLAP